MVPSLFRLFQQRVKFGLIIKKMATNATGDSISVIDGSELEGVSMKEFHFPLVWITYFTELKFIRFS